MSNKIFKDCGELYTRLFDCRPFLNGEINFFLKEFEEKREDREIEGLFNALENTVEIRDSAINRNKNLGNTNLKELKSNLESTLTLCHNLIQKNDELTVELNAKQEKACEEREQKHQLFLNDMTQVCKRIDNTFEEKEEELREFYIDLEHKLHINK